MYISKLSVLLIIVFAAVSSSISAEPGKGIITGTVVSTEGELLCGAHIALPSADRGTVTGTDGRFTITHLPDGSYAIAVSFIGYTTEIRTIEVVSGRSAPVSISLSPTTLETESIIVTGSPYAVNSFDSPQNVCVVDGREKLRVESASLGKTLESSPGVYSLSAGSAAGKPMVRGHTGERVLILSDGIAQEYQQYGERHSPNVESFNYDRIEVIKGAASLLYGSDALGGAVNLISHPFHFGGGGAIEADGACSGGYSSNNNEYMTGISLRGAMETFSLKGSIVRRKGDNYYAPDASTYAESLVKRDPKFSGEIPYTNFQQLNGAIGIGYLSPVGIISVDYNHYFNQNNFLLPTGGPIGLQLKNDIVNVKANMPFDRFIVKPRFSYQRNERLAAREGVDFTSLPDSAAVDLLLDVSTARVELENVDVLSLSGTVGMEIKLYDHENLGSVPLQPTGYFTNYAFFLFEEWRHANITVDVGGRFDYRDQLFYGAATNPLLQSDDSRNYSSMSGSVGVAYKAADGCTFAGSVSRGFRTPSFFNLYVYGNHGGVFAFQIGNPALQNETSLDLSVTARLKNDVVSLDATLFRNMIRNYIFLYNAPGHPLAPPGKPFVFAHSQADAVMTGIELSANLAVTSWFGLNASYSYLKSAFSSGAYEGDELPLMPPHRLIVNAQIVFPDLSVVQSPSFSVHAKIVAAKKSAGIYEPFAQFDGGIVTPDIPFGVCSTSGYALLGFSVGFDLSLFGHMTNVNAEVTNALNTVYRDFLDTYKGYALSPGRGVNVKASIPFAL